MATRSIIAIEIPEERVKTIYCHLDGYPSGNGKMLKKQWNTKEKILELMELGNISSLGHHIGHKVDFENYHKDRYNNPNYNPKNHYQCLAYGRDRGETNQECKEMTLEEFMAGGFNAWEEYIYLFKDGKWFITQPDLTVTGELEFQELTEEIIRND